MTKRKKNRPDCKQICGEAANIISVLSPAPLHILYSGITNILECYITQDAKIFILNSLLY